MPFLQAKAISKKFSGFTALKAVDFSVEPGSIVGLLGVNGAGKSSLLKVLATLLRPDSGEIWLDGIDLLRFPQKAVAKIGYLGESAPSFVDLRVIDHLRFMGRLKKISAGDLDKEVKRVVETTHIADRENFVIGNLSKGFQQRVALAACLLGDTSLLLMDEPSSGLDPIENVAMRELILNERKRGKAVVFSTHIVAELEAIADEVVVIDNGSVSTHLRRDRKYWSEAARETEKNAKRAAGKSFVDEQETPTIAYGKVKHRKQKSTEKPQTKRASVCYTLVFSRKPHSSRKLHSPERVAKAPTAKQLQVRFENVAEKWQRQQKKNTTKPVSTPHCRLSFKAATKSNKTLALKVEVFSQNAKTADVAMQTLVSQLLRSALAAGLDAQLVCKDKGEDLQSLFAKSVTKVDGGGAG